MPARPSMMARLLGARRLQEHLEALHAVEAARVVRDEQFAKSRLYRVPPLERRAAPIDPPKETE